MIVVYSAKVGRRLTKDRKQKQALEWEMIVWMIRAYSDEAYERAQEILRKEKLLFAAPRGEQVLYPIKDDLDAEVISGLLALGCSVIYDPR